MPNWRTSPEAVVERRLITMGPPIIFRPLETTDGPLLADFYATLSPRDSTYFRPHELDEENAGAPRLSAIIVASTSRAVVVLMVPSATRRSNSPSASGPTGNSPTSIPARLR